MTDCANQSYVHIRHQANTRSMDTWHCIYYKHLNAGMSWHSQVVTKVAEAVEGKKTIVYMDFVKDVAPVAIALQERHQKCSISCEEAHG